MRENDNNSLETQIKACENEIFLINQRIADLQREIVNVQSPEFVNPLKEMNEKLLEKQKKENKERKVRFKLKKKEKYENKLNDLNLKSRETNNKIKNINERLQLLKEDKVCHENAVVNFISQKETLEELVHNYKLFPQQHEEKEMNESVLQTMENFTIKEAKSLEFTSTEILCLPKQVLKEELYLYFNNQPRESLDRPAFIKIIDHCMKFIGVIETEDFFHLMTKKIHDYLKIYSDNLFREEKDFTFRDIDLEVLMN